MHGWENLPKAYSDDIDIFDLKKVLPPPKDYDPLSKPIQPSDNAKLSETRSELAGASTPKAVIFAGGVNEKGLSKIIDYYHTDAGKWDTIMLSTSRRSLVGISSGDYAFFAGGFVDAKNGNGSVATDIVEIFDASKYPIKSVGTEKLSLARASIAAAVVEDLVFFGPGDLGVAENDPDKDKEKFRTVDVYNVTAKSWSVAQLSLGRYHMAAARFGPRAVYFAGGVVMEEHANLSPGMVTNQIDVISCGGPAPTWPPTKKPIPTHRPTRRPLPPHPGPGPGPGPHPHKHTNSTNPNEEATTTQLIEIGAPIAGLIVILMTVCYCRGKQDIDKRYRAGTWDDPSPRDHLVNTNR